MNRHALDSVIARSQLLYTQQEVDAAIVHLAETLNKKLSGAEWTVVTVLNGGIVFAGLIMPRLRFAICQDYIHATRYQNGTSGGKLKILAKPTTDVTGKNVLLLDDIFDRGVTLSEISHYFYTNGAADVRSAVMVRKQFALNETPTGYGTEFLALTVPNVYVYGMGMDFKGWLRNAPGIYAYSEDVPYSEEVP